MVGKVKTEEDEIFPKISVRDDVFRRFVLILTYIYINFI